MAEVLRPQLKLWVSDDPMAEQRTLPLPVAAVKSAASFQAYLKAYQLHPLQVAQAGGVRYLTVWNILRGNPVQVLHALYVRMGLQKLTGVVYTAPIHLFDDLAHQKLRRRKEQQAGVPL